MNGSRKIGWKWLAGVSRRYTFYLASIASLLLINQAFIQFSLSRKEEDARLIYIAGRQSMLSQRLNLFYYRFTGNDGPGYDSISAINREWNKGHYALLTGSKELGIHAVTDREARAELLRLSPYVDLHHRIAANWCNNPEARHDLVDPLQARYLSGMERVSQRLERDADAKLLFVVTMELILATITILILYLEFRFLISPLARNLSAKIQQLKVQNRKLEHIAFFQNHLLREPLTTLVMLTTAIEAEEDPAKKANLLTYFPHLLKKIDKITREIVEEVNLQ